MNKPNDCYICRNQGLPECIGGAHRNAMIEDGEIVVESQPAPATFVKLAKYERAQIESLVRSGNLDKDAGERMLRECAPATDAQPAKRDFNEPRRRFADWWNAGWAKQLGKEGFERSIAWSAWNASQPTIAWPEKSVSDETLESYKSSLPIAQLIATELLAYRRERERLERGK